MKPTYINIQFVGISYSTNLLGVCWCQFCQFACVLSLPNCWKGGGEGGFNKPLSMMINPKHRLHVQSQKPCKFPQLQHCVCVQQQALQLHISLSKFKYFKCVCVYVYSRMNQKLSFLHFDMRFVHDPIGFGLSKLYQYLQNVNLFFN